MSNQNFIELNPSRKARFLAFTASFLSLLIGLSFWYPNKSRAQQSIADSWGAAELAVMSKSNVERIDVLRPTLTPTPSGCTNDTWTATSTTNAPAARVDQTAVWTGSEMIVWGGGYDTSGHRFNTGAKYNPTIDSWTATSTTNAPVGRNGHTAVWTGSEMIVWGGNESGVSTVNSGGRYDPNTNSWSATSTANAPAARIYHSAVWTGSEMIVWGGSDLSANYKNTGARYNPSTDTCTAISTTNAPTARIGHTAIWAGSEMIVCGGADAFNTFVNIGGRYNPNTNSWTAISNSNAPTARAGHTAIWTGSEMIVWGGDSVTGGDTSIFNTGGRYNPITDTWTAISTTNAPAARSSHTAV